VEVLGPDDPDVDVEVIALASQFFDDLGLSQVTLLLNTLGEHSDRAAFSEGVRTYLESNLDGLSEQARDTLTRNPLRVLDSKRREDAEVISGAPSIGEFLSEGASDHFARVRAGLDSLGIAYKVDDRLVRGLDYYRRTTFEFAAEALDAAQNAIGGGGRYDGLVEDLGGPPTDGIGFALGVDRILLACDAEEVNPAPGPTLDAYVVDLTGGGVARDITHHLRAGGLSADRRFGGGSMKAQMKAADKSGARFAVLVGEDELEAGEVTVRTLRREQGHEQGDPADFGSPQQRVRRDELIEFLRSQT
jgi:histidyl-tRNA synthetase